MNSPVLSTGLCDSRAHDSKATYDVPRVLLGKTATKNQTAVQVGVADAISEVQVWGSILRTTKNCCGIGPEGVNAPTCSLSTLDSKKGYMSAALS